MSSPQLATRDASQQLERRGDFSAKVLEATSQTVLADRASAKVIAGVLGLKERAVYAIAAGEMPLKVAHVPGFVKATGCYLIPDLIENAIGRVAFPLITVGANPDEAQLALAREVQAFGEFLAETAHDMADGRIDRAELRRMLPRIDSVIARACEFRETVVQKAELDARTGATV